MQKNLTQEQLAEKLYVSRTAVSKWESGKGYPNIESLKCISKFFSVSIDELLSGEALLDIAQEENRSNLSKIYRLLFGIADVMVIAFIILPLYGKLQGTYIYAVNLLSFTDTSMMNLTIYWSVFVALISLGIVEILLTYIGRHVYYNVIVKCSIILTMVSVCFFAAAREPYVTTLMFLLFVSKAFLLIRQRQTK